MKRVKSMCAKYDTNVWWDIDDIARAYEFDTEDIVNIEVVKWVQLEITLKDGTVHSIEGSSDTDATDWKWSVKEEYFDKDFRELDVDDLERYEEEC